METLFNLVQLISSNNIITRPKGIFVPADNVNHELLDEHKSELNSLLVENDLQMSVMPPRVETTQEAKFDSAGDYVGQKDVERIVVKNGVKQSGGLWFSKSKNNLDAFTASLQG